MKITAIETQNKQDRVNIYIDKEFAFGLSLELKYIYKLEIGKEINKSLIEEITSEERIKKAINSALNFLSYRQRSEYEVRKKLADNNYEEYFIERAISFCKEQNYIDDEAFAKSFAKDKINLNNFGSYRIKRDLMLKGVSEDIIESVFIQDKDDEYSRAFEIASKKYLSYKDEDKDKVYRKLGGFLQRKGYSFDIVSNILRELLG